MFDGNGNWTSDFSAQADRDNGIKILASRFDNIFIDDIKESFENCLTKDGQIAPIGNFNMGGQKITNLNNGVNDNDAVNMSQFNNAVHKTGDEAIGGVKTFNNAINLANGTWNAVGDDAYIGDRNLTGCVCIKGNNGNTGIRLFPRNESVTTLGFYIDENDGNALKLSNPTHSANRNGSVTAMVGQSLSGNGYVKYNNGLIIQWGEISSGSNTITFSTPFSSGSSYQITTTVGNTSRGSYSDTITGKTSTKATVDFYTYPPHTYWIAIGY